ncbi:MAG: TetR/AcrR family transcriptional regulator [Actinobacteria bacterium]|nr:TetR/AcrR family transcriptional regulator [Actinomycetota bacterium]
MSEPTGARARLLDAALACIDRWGLAKTSLEDIANEAGLSRATVYRYFPGGRDQVISETITWEVGHFFARLGEEVADLPDIAAKLERGLVFGHQAIVEHRLLQQVLSTEPEEFLEELSETTPLVHAVVCAYLADLLRHERLRTGIDVDTAADYLARLFFSYLGSQGHWDLTNPDEAKRLVATQFLPGIVV